MNAIVLPVLSQLDFVVSEAAHSPIVVSVPHDGDEGNTSSLFEERAKGLKFSDDRTWQVARSINRTRAACSLVRGLFPRRFIDYNRSLKQKRGDHACFDQALVPFYAAYHGCIDRLLKQSINRFGTALLIDLHGFENQPVTGPFDIILGTRHRRSVKTDVDLRLGRFLLRRGYSVHIPTDKRQKGEKFTGGYTVKRHAKLEGVDAIQIELAPHLRPENDRVMYDRLSRDFREFFVEYKQSL